MASEVDMTAIKYRAYGAKNNTIKEGLISFDEPLPKNEQARTNILMEEIYQDVGENLFDTCVAGVHMEDIRT